MNENALLSVVYLRFKKVAQVSEKEVQLEII